MERKTGYLEMSVSLLTWVSRVGATRYSMSGVEIAGPMRVIGLVNMHGWGRAVLAERDTRCGLQGQPWGAARMLTLSGRFCSSSKMPTIRRAMGLCLISPTDIHLLGFATSWKDQSRLRGYCTRPVMDERKALRKSL
jgi:hypothetical protein